MSESVIYDARFLCDARLSSLRASSHCLNLHPSSPCPRPWTQTSPSAKTPDFVLKNSLRTVSDYLITYSIQKLAIGHVFLSEALFWPMAISRDQVVNLRLMR